MSKEIASRVDKEFKLSEMVELMAKMKRELEVKTVQLADHSPNTAPNTNTTGLWDYQAQLMLLERQNKHRLTMARQEKNSGPKLKHPDFKFHESIVKILLEKGANVDSKDSNGVTPLSWATEMAIKALLSCCSRKVLTVTRK